MLCYAMPGPDAPPETDDEKFGVRLDTKDTGSGKTHKILMEPQRACFALCNRAERPFGGLILVAEHQAAAGHRTRDHHSPPQARSRKVSVP
jgi:hypothetical protein